MKRRLFLFFIISGFILGIALTGCESARKTDDDIPPSIYPPPEVVQLNTDDGYNINPVTGDSVRALKNAEGEIIKTGIPQLITGKIIDTKSLNKPQVLSLKISTVNTPESIIQKDQTKSKYILVDESKLIKIIVRPNSDTTKAFVFDSTGNVISEGVPVPAQGIIVPCKMPEPVTVPPLSQPVNSIYNLKYLNTYHGLKSRSVNSALQDHKGNIWVAGREGLSCYNGQTIRHFTKAEGLIEDNIYYIMEDSKGNIWIHYGPGHISRFDGLNFIHYKFSYKNYAVPLGDNFMIEDHKGNIWFRGLVNGISRYDGKNFTHFTMSGGLSTFSVRCMMEDRKGNIWFGTHGKGVARFDGKVFTFFTKKDGLNHDIVSAITEDRKGNIWFGTDSSVVRYDGNYFIPFNIPQLDEEKEFKYKIISSVTESDEGNMCFGTYGNGAFIFNGNEYLRISEKEGLSSNFIFKIMGDRQGNIWFCTDKGLSVYKKENYIRLNENSGPFHFEINSLITDNKDGLWLSSMMQGVFFYDGKSLKHYQWEKQEKDPLWIYTMLKDRGGNLWIASGNGVLKYDGKKTLYYSGGCFSYPAVTRSILEDKKGNIWFACSNGLVLYDHQNFTLFNKESGLSSNNLFSLYEDRVGNIWISTMGGGISKINNGQITLFTEKEGLLSNMARSFTGDNSGNIWIGTEGGISRFDGKTFIHFTEKQGLTNGFNFSLFSDDVENIWAVTDKGLTVLPKLLADRSALNDKKNLQGIINYGENEGLNSFYIKGWWDNKKRLWLTQSYEVGLTILDMDRFGYKPDSSKVYLDDIFINGKFIDYYDIAVRNRLGLNPGNDIRFKNLPQQFQLGYKHSRLTFYFHSNDQVTDDKVKYSFKLEGLDKSWSDPSSEAKADYRYIPPGNYTFRVRAINKYQVWGETLEYRIEIIPPFWQQWWFITLVCITAVSLVFWVTKKRTTKILKRQKDKAESEKKIAELEARSQQAILNERLRISSELHDEIGATLSGIAMYSHLSAEQIKKGQSDEVAKSLTIMQQSSAEMVNKLNDIVWLINPEKDSLQKLIERLEEYARDMVAIKNMKVKIEVPANLHEKVLPVETRRNIYLFCKEAINNSVKYSGGSLLELIIKEEDGKLEFTVNDNGKGFDAVMVRRGNGLENMQKRADEIGAELQLKSKEYEGVRVSMFFKIT